METTSLMHEHDHDAEYAEFRAAIQATFKARTANTRTLFSTFATGLFETYLAAMPLQHRQVHNCTACRRFIDTYGRLICVSETGERTSALWDPDAVPAFYRPVVAALRDKAVRRLRIQTLHVTKLEVWGTPQTGEWEHLCVYPHPQLVHRDRVKTPNEYAAERRENVNDVRRFLNDTSLSTLTEALRVLEADAVNRAEKFTAPVRWLVDLKRAAANNGVFAYDDLLWQAVCNAPVGYAHPKASVIGSLIEDIEAGLPFETVRSKFNAKVHGLKYQRPQAPPSAGNIAQAEKLVEKLGIQPSLERRFARLDECQTIWLPKAPAPAAPANGGVFGHLKPKGSEGAAFPSVVLPPVTMSWVKFQRDVMPRAAELLAFISSGREGFIALTTAANPEAPPILKWDTEAERNPVAWYVYHNGDVATNWNLQPGWVEVTAVTLLPTLWGSTPRPHLGTGAILLLKGCKDVQKASGERSGNSLFPECLREDLHGVRSTIEAFSKSAVLHGGDEASACGLDFRAGGFHTGRRMGRLLAKTDTGWTEYVIDRWE